MGNPRLSSANIHYVDPNVRLEIEFENGKDTYVYKGEAVIPDVVVRGYKKNNDGSEEEVDAVDYTLTYKDNDIENPETDTVTATVTATGHGDFEGHTSTKAFTIQYNEVYLTYLEVGFGGNVTVHWGFNGNEDTISGFEVQHSWKDTVNDPDGLRTTKVSGSNMRKVDIVDLSYNDYEFRVRAVSKDAEDDDPEWTDWAECPVKEIKIISPETGSSNADSFGFVGKIDFGTKVDIAEDANGEADVYEAGDSSNPVIHIPLDVDSGQIDWITSEQTGQVSVLEMRSKYPVFHLQDKQLSENPYEIEKLSAGKQYHVAVDERTIEYLKEDYSEYDIPVYFVGIAKSDLGKWNFSTINVTYPGLENPGKAIPDKYYQLVFKEQDWKSIQKMDDGTGGLCYGLCYTVGAYQKGFSYIQKIVTEDLMLPDISSHIGYASLADVPIGEYSKLLEYVQMAHIFQYRPGYKQNIEEERKKVSTLCNTVQAGEGVIISVRASKESKTSHAVYSPGIVTGTASSIGIPIYDSARGGAAVSGSFVETLGVSEDRQSLTNYTYQWYYPIEENFDSSIESYVYSYDYGQLSYNEYLLTSSKELRDQDNLHAIQPENGALDGEGLFCYWLDGNSYSIENAEEAMTLTLSDGKTKIYATIDAGQSVTLDIENKLVSIDGENEGGTAGAYKVRFSMAEDYDTFHDTIIKGTSGGADTILTKTEDGISVQTDVNTVISVSTEENDIETASTKVKLTDGSAQIRKDENGTINVYADLDGDGSYTDIEQTIDDSNESGADDSGSGSGHPGSSDQANKPTVKVNASTADKITVTKKPIIQKPAATKNKITVKWKHFKHTSKKTKKSWKRIKKIQVQCSTDKAFNNIVKTTTVSKSKTKAVIKGLKKNTTYYIRIRYTDGKGYSKWSSVKKIKTKKK